MAITLDQVEVQAGGVLTRVPRGMPVLYGGNRVTTVPDSVADAFAPGDRLIVIQTTGDVLHIPAAEYAAVDAAVQRAREAFAALARVSDEQITDFYERFAARLADEPTWARIAAANEEDVRAARARGRSTTRLVADAKMRVKMIEGLRLWRDQSTRRDRVLETIEHDGWRVEQVVAGLGVIGFVFEGRPNVFADATGVLRSGNTTVRRSGRPCARPACRWARSSSSKVPPTPPAGHSSPTRGWRSPWPAARARRWHSSVRSRARAAFR
jgi:glutamate-5-semialdehyde dehydrogenase